ncbi:cutinase-domain-containing protein [Eremomyces bilateralis CBS 781.70]|uniref:Cutinase n=1 Tax=Eremomyces bilateralis CBS 781.70 TaxID=1392243 RepID=A0A6G1FWJ7_9PEZI|nr:cutinase-domain-containing protein [Eremomyces bilateralis CBS 781.70]KAF1810061.1 cutinase-domain-containing protein [Eremomyces bilateralis CBS 781.70]
MRILSTISLAVLAAAAPVELVERQFGGGGGGSTSNELTQGSCKEVVFIFARGSGEPGNIGMIIGPPLISALKALVPNTAVQGVPYSAGIAGNLQRGGTDQASINTATQIFNQANTKCPDSIIIAGGYSQGAALMHRTIEKLPDNVKNKIAAVVTFGDTQNEEDKGTIPNFPPEKVKIFCNENDGVCGASLSVNAGHMSYSTSMKPAAQFLADGVNKAKQGGGASSGSSSGSSSDGSSGSPTGGPSGLGGLGGISGGGGLGGLSGSGGLSGLSGGLGGLRGGGLGGLMSGGRGGLGGLRGGS